MTAQKNNRTTYYAIATIAAIIVIVGGFLGVLGTVEGFVEKKIEQHPKITTMEIRQQAIYNKLNEMGKQMKDMDNQLDEIERKLSILLKEEYP